MGVITDQHVLSEFDFYKDITMNHRIVNKPL